jgi:hypothetical protein
VLSSWRLERARRKFWQALNLSAKIGVLPSIPLPASFANITLRDLAADLGEAHLRSSLTYRGQINRSVMQPEYWHCLKQMLVVHKL